MTSLRPLPIAAGTAAALALPLLRDAAAGQVALLPYAADGSPPPVPDGAVPDAGTALVVGTSGSTGTPKLAMLPAAALAASARATHTRLGGPGSWLLAMPPHHIAGVQVLLRCVAADTEPGLVDLSDGFTAEAFTHAAQAFEGERRYTSLVPTQLLRVLEDPDASRALSEFDAVLVGGAATSPALLVRAREAGATVVTTYGMSETCGGCVYDGVPLSPTTIRTDDEGRIHLGGATVASGYLGRPDLTEGAFVTDGEGVRWFRTDDLGHRDPGSGRWHVDGRLDDVITTGALKVSPRLVEEALTSLPDVAEAVVLGLEDPEWGQIVAAALVVRPGVAHPSVLQVRNALRGSLADHALPRRIVVLGELPLRGPGKPDRAGIAALFHTRP
ncbi:o-succinylbenzoate--CoA ligase [Pedococcus sp. KACC 23699]|uniref:O-succinylbenzoate--CoA ligase n=1 Tax=Pedococcus sp. KACC 23699 TaxID=3149228 RepID=A0AAU7JPD5_9MICO